MTDAYTFGKGTLSITSPTGDVLETYEVKNVTVTLSKEPINAETYGDDYRGPQRITSRVDVRLPQSIIEDPGSQEHEVPDDPGD